MSSSSSFETSFFNPLIGCTTVDLGSGAEQPLDCFIIQNRQAMCSMGMSMDWTMKDNMVNCDAAIYRTTVYRTTVYRTTVYRTTVYGTIVHRTTVYRTTVFRATVSRTVSLSNHSLSKNSSSNDSLSNDSFRTDSLSNVIKTSTGDLNAPSNGTIFMNGMNFTIGIRKAFYMHISITFIHLITVQGSGVGQCSATGVPRNNFIRKYEHYSSLTQTPARLPLCIVLIS